LDDPATGIKTRHIAFNPTEKEKLGDGLIINYERSINV
jgi:hypothetical protein